MRRLASRIPRSSGLVCAVHVRKRTDYAVWREVAGCAGRCFRALGLPARERQSFELLTEPIVRRMTRKSDQPEPHVSHQPGSLRCMVLGCSGRTLASVEQLLVSVHCSLVRTDARNIDIGVVVGAADSAALRDRIAQVRTTHPDIAIIAIVERGSIDLASYCMQQGVADILELPVTTHELSKQLLLAAAKTRDARKLRALSAKRALRIRDLKRQLTTNQDSVQQVGDVCESLANGYRVVADQFGHQIRTAQLITEVQTLLRLELDVESLLRTTLEFMLRKVGAVNAAIFLPSSCGDFTLGAYVNYDCPRDAAQHMLEDLCHALAPAFEHRPGLHIIADGGKSPHLIGEQTGFVAESTLAIHSASSDGECIAVLAIFRDKRQPFDDNTIETVRIIADRFGDQLTRVIKTNTRHKPARDAWDVA